jgi:hypothetical protein
LAGIVGKPRHVRRFAIPRHVDPPIASFVSDRPLKEHPDYRSAKAGDARAAARLVANLVKPETVALAAQRFSGGVRFLPVAAEESSGANAIPVLLAHYYAAATGGEVIDDVVQANRARRTADGEARRARHLRRVGSGRSAHRPRGRRVGHGWDVGGPRRSCPKPRCADSRGRTDTGASDRLACREEIRRCDRRALRHRARLPHGGRSRLHPQLPRC